MQVRRVNAAFLLVACMILALSSASCGGGPSRPMTSAAVTAAAAPAIVVQPQSQAVAAGQTAAFSVSATGMAPLRFQWRRDGVNIAGATAAAYTTPATTAAASGATFDVVVTNGMGSATSASARLIVNSGTPAVAFSPGSMFFGIQAVGTGSPLNPVPVQLSNTGTAALTITSILMIGPDNSDFGLSQSCPGTLAAGASCTLNISFTPVAGGPRKAGISVTDNAPGSPHALIVTGVGSAISLSAATLGFNPQDVGTASPVQMLAITNQAGAPVNVWQIAVLGTSAGEFPSTTTCAVTLASNASCNVMVSFKPAAGGLRSASLLISSDGGGSPESVPLSGTGNAPTAIVVSPQNAVIADPGGSPASQAYTATGYFNDGTRDLTAQVTWASTNPAVATVNSAGTAMSQSLGSGQTAAFTSITASMNSVRGTAILSVTSHTGNGFAGVFTQHNDNARTGQNLHETALTLAIVGNINTFSKKFSQSVDGQVYAQPLYVPNVAIAGKGTHNVVFVATEHDTVYALDADNNTGPNAAPLWQASLIDVNHGATVGETTVSSADVSCGDLSPEIGITSTPVIDPSTNTLYAEAKSKLTNGTFIHRLHALDITSGNEMAGSPVAITASVPGTGDGSSAGTVVFNSLRQMNRPGLLLVNGLVYLAYASHCDNGPYHGWILAYDAATLTQKSVFNTTPNGGLGGIWMSGAGLAADDQVNIFTATGNGTFDTTAPVVDFGDTIFKVTLNSGAFMLTDYFTPFNQASLSAADADLGSGGVVLLPSQPGAHPNLLVQSGKQGTIYLIDRDQMTAGNQHYCSGCASDTQVVQEMPSANTGTWSSPAYWNGNLYFCGQGDQLRQFQLSSGLLTPLVGLSANPFQYPGATPAVSANGGSNAIVWVIDSTSPAVLHAYDATQLATELYSTNMAAGNRDQAGNGVKFSVPTIANGKVYIGTATGLYVYGP